MPLYAGKYAICAFLQNMQNMLRSHDRCKPVSLVKAHKMQTIALTLYKYKSWWHVLCEISTRHCCLL